MGRFTAWYGAGPLHLVALVAGAAVSAYAVTRVTALDTLVAIGLWFAGTLVAHDLVLFPIYSAADNAGAWLRHRASSPGSGSGPGSSVPVVPVVNHVRVPVVLSGLLLLAWFPLVLRLSRGYEHITGRSDAPYLGRWLLVTGVLFAGSALVYAVRLLLARRRRTAVSPGTTG